MNKTMELMMRLHLHNKRQGPGSEEATRLALALAGIRENNIYKVADLGCGTGAQTITLAKALKGNIVAVDLFDEFLAQLRQNLSHENTLAQIDTLQASIDDLPFKPQEFDLIWSEGAVYNIGFKKGISYWKDFLKMGGLLAVSEISWLTEKRPAELTDFWQKEYPEVDTVAGKISALEQAGYRVLACFALPEDCWLENYYYPLLQAHKDFLNQFSSYPQAHTIIQTDVREYELYKKYKKYYSYGFYIAQKI